ncbi:MAG: S8 family serine peptidase [Oscillospiraceae bacterium]|nr:S8 family serine peptidase [Oscillospiraceae bacterium]
MMKKRLLALFTAAIMLIAFLPIAVTHTDDLPKGELSGQIELAEFKSFDKTQYRQHQRQAIDLSGGVIGEPLLSGDPSRLKAEERDIDISPLKLSMKSSQKTGQYPDSTAAYIESFADMLAQPAGLQLDGDLPGNGLVDVIVWLQELPRTLRRKRNRKPSAAQKRYEDRGAGARKRIRSSRKKQIRHEYSEVFAGFSMTVDAREAASLASMPGVFAVVPDGRVQALSQAVHAFTPDYLYGFDGMKESREIFRIGEIHQSGITGKNVKIAVLDTGIDYNHPDFEGVYRDGYNFVTVDDPGRDSIDSPYSGMETTYEQWLASEAGGDPGEFYTSHGTHVAGTISATASHNNGSSRALGMAPEAGLYSARVLGPYGRGSFSDVIAAVDDCTADGGRLPKMDVINLSLGSEVNTAYEPVNVAVNNAVIAGVNVAVAAGNDAVAQGASPADRRAGTIGVPAPAYLPVAVAASQYGGQGLNSDKTPAYFSSIGPVKETAAIKPDIIAPGRAIYSTMPAFSMNDDYNAGDYTKAYRAMSGTSMASPHIAGILALMVQAYPDATPQELKARLMNTADTRLLKAYNGKECSVFEVGAGFVAPYRAIIEEKEENVYFTVADDIPGTDKDSWIFGQALSSLSFGDAEADTSSRMLTVTAHGIGGLGDSGVKAIYNNNTNFSGNAAEGIKLVHKISGNELTVWLEISPGVDDHRYEGYLSVDISGGRTYSLPWAVRIGTPPERTPFEWVLFSQRPVISTTADPAVRSAGGQNPLNSNSTTAWIYWEGEWPEAPYDSEKRQLLHMYLYNAEAMAIEYQYQPIDITGVSPALYPFRDFIGDTAYKWDGSGWTLQTVANGAYYLALRVEDSVFFAPGLGVVFTDGTGGFEVRMDIEARLNVNDSAKGIISGRIFSPALNLARKHGFLWTDVEDFLNDEEFPVDQKLNVLGEGDGSDIFALSGFDEGGSLQFFPNGIQPFGNSLYACDENGYFKFDAEAIRDYLDRTVVGVEGFYWNWNGEYCTIGGKGEYYPLVGANKSSLQVITGPKPTPTLPSTPASTGQPPTKVPASPAPAPKSFVVTFKNGGTTLKRQIVARGQGASAPTIAGLKRTGHKFAGWSRSFTNVQGDIMVNARWMPLSYKITWRLGKGRLSSKARPKRYTFGKGLKLRKPARKGYSFKGWYLRKKKGKKIRRISKKRTGRVQLFARWKKSK